MHINAREKTTREFDLLGLTELQMDTLRRAMSYYLTWAKDAPHSNKQASVILANELDKTYRS